MKLRQENDKIIVTELRPISDLPNRVEVFMFLVRGDGFEYFDITSLDCLYHESADVIGWVPKPIYQPESKTQDKTALYEKIRKLNPREFAELHKKNIETGVAFDELLDKWPE